MAHNLSPRSHLYPSIRIVTSQKRVYLMTQATPEPSVSAAVVKPQNDAKQITLLRTPTIDLPTSEDIRISVGMGGQIHLKILGKGPKPLNPILNPTIECQTRSRNRPRP